MIGHESALERDFVLLQRLDPAVLAIEEQPVKISWAASDGRVRYYTPDYRVVRQDGTELVEVKYRQDLRANWSQYRDRLIAARDWARLHGMSFRIATERDPDGASAERQAAGAADARPDRPSTPAGLHRAS
ncbi:Tn7 transposase TnsA N-terminal domain-containing protein [Azospirillum sp. A26]|uniref:Tn7 transposase TnsA N-terminal domain-containing protein n=1 Tax=Azospirillum sp. A26 TaxID=3160607 RepID=UPI003672A2DC